MPVIEWLCQLDGRGIPVYESIPFRLQTWQSWCCHDIGGLFLSVRCVCNCVVCLCDVVFVFRLSLYVGLTCVDGWVVFVIFVVVAVVFWGVLGVCFCCCCCCCFVLFLIVGWVIFFFVCVVWFVFVCWRWCCGWGGGRLNRSVWRFWRALIYNSDVIEVNCLLCFGFMAVCFSSSWQDGKIQLLAD